MHVIAHEEVRNRSEPGIEVFDRRLQIDKAEGANDHSVFAGKVDRSALREGLDDREKRGAAARPCGARQSSGIVVSMFILVQRLMSCSVYMKVNTAGPEKESRPKPGRRRFRGEGAPQKVVHLRQVIAERREDHIVDSVRISANTRPSVAGDVGVLGAEAEAAPRSGVELVPEPAGAFDELHACQRCNSRGHRDRIPQWRWWCSSLAVFQHSSRS